MWLKKCFSFQDQKENNDILIVYTIYKMHFLDLVCVKNNSVPKFNILSHTNDNFLFHVQFQKIKIVMFVKLQTFTLCNCTFVDVWRLFKDQSHGGKN